MAYQQQPAWHHHHGASALNISSIGVSAAHRVSERQNAGNITRAARHKREQQRRDARCAMLRARRDVSSRVSSAPTTSKAGITRAACAAASAYGSDAISGNLSVS